MRQIFLCALSLALAFGESKDVILMRLDKAAAEFKAVSVKLKHTHYSKVLDEKDPPENGEERLRRIKNQTSGIVEFTGVNPRVVHFVGNTIENWPRNSKEVEVYDASQFTKNLNQYLLLGFGTTSKDLNNAYTIGDGVSETVGSMRATRLELRPKEKDLQKQVAKIDLWVAESQSTPLQIRVTETSGDYELYEYSDAKINPTLPDSAFDLKLPAGISKRKVK